MCREISPVGSFLSIAHECCCHPFATLSMLTVIVPRWWWWWLLRRCSKLHISFHLVQTASLHFSTLIPPANPSGLAKRMRASIPLCWWYKFGHDSVYHSYCCRKKIRKMINVVCVHNDASILEGDRYKYDANKRESKFKNKPKQIFFGFRLILIASIMTHGRGHQIQ